MAARQNLEAIPKPTTTSKDGIRIQKVGNSRGFVIPADILSYLEERMGAKGREAAFSLTFKDEGDRLWPTIEITEGYVRQDRDEGWAAEIGKRAFVVFYHSLQIHPGMAEDEQHEAAIGAHGEGAVWPAVRSFYEENDIPIIVEHGCVDTAVYSNADADIIGCDDGEFCGWGIPDGKLTNIIKKTFDDEAKRCWPDDGLRMAMMYPDF